MSFNSWLQNLRSALAPRRGQRQHGRRGSLRAATHRPNLEVLEDRCLPSFLVTADFNGDGWLDLATANAGGNTVSVLLGNGDGTFLPAQNSPTGTGPQSLAVGDFNADGKLDLATANADDVGVLLGNGDGTFQAPSSMGVDGSPTSVAVGDFNADGKLDLGVTSNVYYPAGYGAFGYYYASYAGRANVLLGTGTGSFSGPITTYLYWGYFTSGVVADFNGDGKQDLVMGVADGYGTIGVAFGTGTGAFEYPMPLDTGFDNQSVAVGDLNADGKLDLVAASGIDVTVVLDGGLVFVQKHYAEGSRPTSVVLGDFEGDGKLDIATNVSILRGYGDGTFAAAENYAGGWGASAVAAGDFNSDGWLDIANSGSALINDQSWPFLPPPVSVSDATVTEGNTGTVNATFTVTLLYASNVDVTVHYETADISAAAGSDYTAASGDVIIPAGQTSRTFTVAVNGDRLVEPTETFAVNLSAPTNATIGDGRGIGTILDNEPLISISDVSRFEGKSPKTTLFTFTVTLSAAYDQEVTMSYRTVDGTATTSDGDYVARTGTLTFAPGETMKTITIEVKGDRKWEANETFYLDLFGNSGNSVFTKNRGIGTILNDD